MKPPSVLNLVRQRWLALSNSAAAIFLAMPLMAPALMHYGRADLANLIYSAYRVTCHEWPFRAYFLFGPSATQSAEQLQVLGIGSVYSFVGSTELGYKTAFCQRNIAIYVAVLVAGLVYAGPGRRLQALSFGAYLVLIAPMAVDGLSQLGGWRESTWELRTLTGLLFGGASVWLIYPRIADLVEARPIARSPLPNRGLAT